MKRYFNLFSIKKMALGDGPVPLQAAGDVRGLRGLPERVVGPGEERAVRVSGV